MSAELEQFERLVEHEADLLRDLPVVRPSRASVARTRAAVTAAAQAARRGRAVRWGPALATAAAVVLAVGLASFLWTAPAAPSRLVAYDAEVDALLDAVETSNDRLAFLLEEGWLVEGTLDDLDEVNEVDEFLDDLEEGLNELNSLDNAS
jgi:hypothetical protein